MAAKSDTSLESVADDFLFAFPQIIRRVTKPSAHSGMKRFDPSIFILMVVMKHGSLPMSEIGRRMGISKPYMTVLVDKLIDEGLVKRVPGKGDRRIINITITKAGKDYQRRFKTIARQTIKKNLSSLSSEDIEELRESMERIRTVVSKLDSSNGKGCR